MVGLVEIETFFKSSWKTQSRGK